MLENIKPNGTAAWRASRLSSAARQAARLGPLLPAVILLLAFLAGPIVYALYGSLTNSALTGSKAANPDFIGLQNYVSLFTSEDFWHSVWLTVLFVLASAVVGQNVLGMILALLMRVSPKGVATFVGGVVVTVWVLPEIVAAYAMYAFFSTDGTLNQLLTFIGLDGPSWLLTFPMFAVILANIWRGTAFSMMVYGAALSDVPTDINEAAMVDGANARQRLFRVTLPVIKGAITTNLLLTTLQTLAVFTLIYVMTAGGPGTSSSTLPILAYQEAFKFSQVGYGTAIAVVTLAVGGIFAFVYIKLLKPEVK